MRGQTIFAIVDLTDDEVDDLALLWLQRRFRVLQREVSTERGRGMGKSGVKVRHEAERLFQIVEDRLVVGRDVVAGGNGKGGHGRIPFHKMTTGK